MTMPLSLDTVLRKAQTGSVEFPYLLANHVPMVLIALDRLGATPERLDEWYETYREGHQVPSIPAPVAAIDPYNWTDALGERTREADFRGFFVGEVQRLGIDRAIRNYLPVMTQGLAASATHPLMRLAYGVLKNDAREVGHALGYWATTFLPLPAPGRFAGDTEDPAAVLAAITDIPGIHEYETETDLLWHNIRAVAALEGFAPVIDRLIFRPDTVRQMTSVSLAAFAATLDFSALHAVTGMHWMRLVTWHVNESDREPLYRAFWQVIASLMPKIGFPTLPDAEAIEAMRSLPCPDWPEIRTAAIASYDEHDISLTFSAQEEQKAWGGDRLYRVAAAKRLKLID
ncbi:questin oxidase family protein [Martelella sp. HB161492]|uniref:questin oxidase family protein n=1 Tax=Martelella sp. HB161492 TaxID=2720726 RepID=UPI001590E95F|nr:questin oxidase family protein [Martelella sp. HB161492]